ncbi:MAG: hypothetical protein FWH59_01415 [Lentimicrobiaceae bacterium]|nr:hypothetical protein [Lentimicrobiaceae bacterium]
MKKQLFFILMATITTAMFFFFSGCKKDDDKKNGGNGGNTNELVSGAFDGKVTATVESPDVINVTAILNAEIIDGALHGVGVGETTYANGGFSITLPEEIPEEYLESVTDFFEGIGGDIKYSQTSAKLAGVDFFGDDGEYYLGYYNYATSDQSNVCFFVYTNKDVTVTGGTNIAVSLKKGWNRMYYTENGDGALTTKAPNGLKWHYNSFQSSKKVMMKQ